ncbi:MAG TPA: hypothetical protein VFV34_17065 [Blastocatellia bacterium]|nr:hypothetical protein [Blastocatellia bacterium]
MRKLVLGVVAVTLLSTLTTSAHDPRTVAKDFSHSLTVDGAGKLTISYKSLHWNEPQYNAAKQNEQLRNRFNTGLWKKIGKLDAEFDVVMSGVKVAKGSYSLGINFDANDNFKLVLGGASEIMVPLTTATDTANIEYLTFDIRPTDKPDTFVVEGRSGKFRCSAEMKVPYLAEHEHAK